MGFSNLAILLTKTVIPFSSKCCPYIRNLLYVHVGFTSDRGRRARRLPVRFRARVKDDSLLELLGMGKGEVGNISKFAQSIKIFELYPLSSERIGDGLQRFP